MIIIPAIDIIDSKVVRLTKGDYNNVTVYNKDPLKVARQFEDAGVKRLHLVDLEGARSGLVKNWKVLELIAAKTKLVIDFSGGISSLEQANTAISCGADYIAVGSIAARNEPLFLSWLSKIETTRFIIGADVKNELIAVKGWTETTNVSVFDLIGKYLIKGIQQFFCTDISKDGMMRGPSYNLYKKILSKYPSADLIASGGISSIRDIEQLKESGCKGAIIGKALYQNKIELKQLKKFL